VDHFDPAALAAEFLAQRARGVFFPPEWVGRLSPDEAYRIQIAIAASRVAGGERQVGWKVGLTAKPIQDQFGVHEPWFGFLMNDAPHESGAAWPFDSLFQPGLENEICMRMGSALVGPGVTQEVARSAIATVMPAFEIIETRGDFSGEIQKGVVDNLQQKGIVVGAGVAYDGSLDLSGVRLAVRINGSVVAEATGEAVLGDPVNSIVFLANRLADFGLGLRLDDLVMTGSFTRQFAISHGDAIDASFDGIGDVSARFP